MITTPPFILTRFDELNEAIVSFFEGQLKDSKDVVVSFCDGILSNFFHNQTFDLSSLLSAPGPKYVLFLNVSTAITEKPLELMSKSTHCLDNILDGVSNWVEACADERKELLRHLDNLQRAEEIMTSTFDINLEKEFPVLSHLSMAHSTFDWDAETKTLIKNARKAAELSPAAPNKFTVELKDKDGAPLGESLPKGHELQVKVFQAEDSTEPLCLGDCSHTGNGVYAVEFSLGAYQVSERSPIMISVTLHDTNMAGTPFMAKLLSADDERQLCDALAKAETEARMTRKERQVAEGTTAEVL